MTGCICEGNWRKIVAEYEPLIGQDFHYQGKEWQFFGLVHGGDDYYYGLREHGSGKIALLSCVGDFAGWDVIPANGKEEPPA